MIYQDFGRLLVIQIPSFTKKGKFYIIDDDGHCNCPGYFYRRTCKHVTIAKELMLGPFQSIKTDAVVIDDVNPATVLCLVCNKPLQSVVELPSQKHGRCQLK